MIIAILTLLSALSISSVAIFYSVIGLATIFPGAFWPVVIMGSVLEVGKLITASWLYRNWKQTKWLLKSYLTIAVVILSLITSMGIFGFLSKAHLEQNLAEDTVTQRIEIINDKIANEQLYITRQKETIARIDKSLSRNTTTNTGAIDIELKSLEDAETKFKTLLKVETDTVADLNTRLRTLDKDVSDVLTSDKSFFNEERAAADLKASQKQEREQIAVDIKEAQSRIQILKDDYAQATALIQKRIDSLRQTGTKDNSQVTAQIEKAEQNIIEAQNRIDVLIVEREPLKSDMLKLEAEVGPVKYIAALAVDFGWTDSVNTSEAVRWVILVIICVFDPLAVLLLIAANQSLIRRFPVKVDPPEEIIDLEKPDLDPPPPPPPPKQDPAVEQWNTMIERANQEAKQEQALKMKQEVEQWQKKLEAFNQKVQQPPARDIEIIQQKEDPIEDADKVSYTIQDMVSVKQDNIEDEVKYDIETPVKKDQSEQFSEITYDPDLKKKTEVQNAKPLVIKTTKPTLPIPKNDQERKGLLNKLHQEHGKFQDISDVELKKERDNSNVAQFLEDVVITEQDARNHPPITQSRMSFFEDYLDDIKRGDVTAENLPPDIAKTCAILLSNFDNPAIVEPKGAGQPDTEVMTVEGLKEKFAPEPKTEDRDITEEELDKLLEGYDDKTDLQDYDIVISGGKKIRVPKKTYIQNEEQNVSNNWSKIKEVDLPEPEKNELDIADLPNTDEEEIVDIADSVKVENVLPNHKIERHKQKMLSDEQYREKIEERINQLITKIENKEITINELSPEDQKVILELMENND